MKFNSASIRSIPQGIAWSSTLGFIGTLAAQTATPATTPETTTPTADGAADLPEVVVSAETEKVYKPERLQTQKYTVPLRDVPQTVTVVPKAVIQERGATSLRDVLRNTPGISIQAGEGGVPAGDNMSIRGFSARTDLFVDGVRDFGGYTRDPFNMEQVEVAKGPSSANAGRGSTGGSINMVSKTPTLEQSYQADTGVGTDNYFRSTFDINQPLSDHIALRVNTLYHTADTPGRGWAEEERYGLAASLAFGLGTDTRLILSYFHLEQEGMPDYGIPWVPASGDFSNGLGSHANSTPPVSFENYYGILDRDYEKTRTDIATIQFEHDFNDNFKLTNTMRVGQTARDSVITAPRFTDSDTGTAGNQYDGTLKRELKSRDQYDTILTDQINLVAKFETGLLKHDLVIGSEITYEASKNHDRNSVVVTPNTNIFHPTPHDKFLGKIVRTGAYTDSESLSLSAYAFDTIHIGEQWEVSGGLRYDRFDVSYKSVDKANVATYLDRTDSMVSWRAAVVYKPVEYGSIYLGYGTSFNPSAEGLTLSTSATASNNLEVEPEQSNTLELGTKWDLLSERLQLTAAVFRTVKTNARTQDPADDTDTTVLDGEQEVQGFELGFAGSITDHWRVFGGYTFLDSEVTKSKNPSEIGRTLSNTPRHSASLWTVYELPKGFEVGLGAQFTDERFNNNTSSARKAPSFCIFDAMVAYKINEKASLRLNIYNLADTEYIDSVGGGHFIPGTGRSAVLSASIKF